MSKHMLVLPLCCPHCGVLLTQNMQVHLDAHVVDTNQDGTVYLSAVFGDYSVESELEIAAGAVVDFRCPECDASIMLSVPCRLCRAPMASLRLTTGGYVEFCSRRGCKGHALGGVGDIDQMMSLLNKMFDTPYD
jgi:predicted RNA-binding Zn-ribbon protein involved in translation (DUF1610 family)